MNAPRYVWILVAVVLGLLALILLFRVVDFNDEEVGMAPTSVVLTA